MKKFNEIIKDIRSWGTFPAILLVTSLLLIGMFLLVFAIAALGMTVSEYSVNASSTSINDNRFVSSNNFYVPTLRYSIITDKETGVKYLWCCPIGNEKGATMTVLYNEKGEVLVGE